MTSEKGGRKDKNQNIQVFVRLRPLNQRERDIKSIGVVDVVNNREIVVRQSQQTSHTKKFTFDRAFGPLAKQLEIYQDVVSPLIEEVLAGYNCTVFAYGQTGTGKTHTMVGEHTGEGTNWQNDPLAGIIPRALSQLFDELRLSNTEYTVRVSYLELYNEELFDLLSGSEDNSKLRIYEDVTRKGSNIVNGLEEITVYNKNEVYKIMAQGQERKRVASTLMNAQSSRSHTVFTIVVHMKENSPEGEELVKIGKLNLVDLAGSENISKAGSDNPAKRERARECVNINQSLLTLGRVITALVERHPHIPYRESKLTRILQESLGGRTKTSIIATISPGHKDLEETMSTLEYAHRAKNIQNKPEINQKMTKKAILKEYAEEIDRLKRDLQASRDKNGVYLANETYAEITLLQEEQKKEIQELLLHKRAMEEEREKMESIFGELNEKLTHKQSQLEQTARKLDTTKMKLNNTCNMLQTTKLHFEEQKYLVSKQSETEHKLSGQAEQLLSTAETATGHVVSLHNSVDKRRVVESSNLEITKMYREQSAQQRDNLRSVVDLFVERLATALTNLYTNTESHGTESITVHQQNNKKSEDLLQRLVEAITEIKSATSSTTHAIVAASSSHRQQLHDSVGRHADHVERLLRQFLRNVAGCVAHVGDVGVASRDTVGGVVGQWCTRNAELVASLRNAHSELISSWRHSESERVDACRRQRDARLANYERRNNKLQGCLTEIATKRAQIEQRFSKQLTELDAERRDTEDRLQRWVEDEKRHFEERLARHVQQEKEVLEDNLKKKMADIEEDKRMQEEMLDRDIKWQEEHIQLSEQDRQLEEHTLEEYCNGADVSGKHVETFSEAFGYGTSSISIYIEEFSNKVLEILEQVTTEMTKSLISAKDNVENEVSAEINDNRTESQQFLQDMNSLFADIVDGSQRVLETIVLNVESHNSHTMEFLTQLSASSSSQATSEQSLLQQQESEVRSTRAAAGGFRESVCEELARQQELEGRYLMREYRVYEPTGSTPVRQEYRYPRSLAATSPHDRILARFRATRQNSHDDDCIVVESDAEQPRNGISDSESSLSEDSAVVFAAPSPPERRSERDRPPERDNMQIMKSTSETDLYYRKKQQKGKENERMVPVSLKKHSKLPAPQSYKRPLADRNTPS